MYFRYITGAKKIKKKGPIPALLKALAEVLLNYIDPRPILALCIGLFKLH